MADELELLSINEAAELLDVSRPTFNKIRKDFDLDSHAIKIGKRIRFPKALILKALSLSDSDKEKVTKDVKRKLCIFSNPRYQNFNFEDDEIDLTNIPVIDPFGTLSLLVFLINKSKAGKKVHLKIDQSITCRHLKQIYFFDMLQMYAPNTTWDESILKGDAYIVSENLLPITVVRHKGAERTTVQKLVELLGVHGFSADRSGHIGGMFGELADNCMTHSHPLLSQRMCFLQAQRHSFEENSHCLVVAIADIGRGIQDSLKTNVKHRGLSDHDAILSAFKHKYSSWPDEAKRGKGLTDALGTTMGNAGVLRVASNEYDFRFNFTKESQHNFIEIDPPLFNTSGTRIGIFYIDHEFEKVSRSDVTQFIDSILG